MIISSHFSSQDDVYELRYGVEDDRKDNPDDYEDPVISDSDSGEAHDDYDTPIDRCIPIQDDSDDSEGIGHEDHDHPFVEIVEPERL